MDAAAAAVTMDDTLNAGSILDLVSQFRNFNPDDLQTQQIPTVSQPIDGVDYQAVEWDQAEPLIEPFRGVEPGKPIEAKQVIVDVKGSSAQSAALTDLSNKLDAAKFDSEPTEVRQTASGTTIAYGPKGRDAAILLARQIDQTPKLVEDDTITGYRVVLTVGKVLPGVRADALPVDQLPPELQSLPTSTAPAAPTTATGSKDETSTTTPVTTEDPSVAAGDVNQPASPGIVPTDPAKAAICR